MISLLFWACLLIVAAVYFGYPMALAAGALGRRKSHICGDSYPFVSVIIAAHNEEACIEAKIQNVLASDYPREKIEILIGSDGSSDGTEEIVRRYERDGVGLLSFPQQHGKSAIQNGLVAVSNGSVLVFTDADCFTPPETLRRVLSHFTDSNVGLVTARPQYSNLTETRISENEGAYLRYETWLRRQESERGLLAMASGSFFALRRSLWRPLDPALGDDFALPLRVALAGLRNILDPSVVAVTHLSQSQPRSMLRLKTRIISKDLRALLVHRAILNPLRFGSVAASLWFHKLLRWLVPYFLLAALAANSFLANHAPYRALLAAQLAFYALALAGLALRGRALPSLLSLPTSFCLVNFAALAGTLKCLLGRKSGQWHPDRRASTSIPSLHRASHDAD
ncbi:MAG TPA: glycosyltransferase [Candidatus Acidoferrales bacterium]|nr:glycosyltransferase [Candidatus Acidoferrales bacterium]